YRKSASFEGIAYAYNDEHLGSEWMNLDKNTEVMDRRRLSEAWYKKTFLEIKGNYGMQQNIEYISSDKLEDVLESEMNGLWRTFSVKWSSSFHTDNCKHEECCKAIVRDGHMKGTRSVCAATDVRTTESEELGSISMGCWKMPVKGSLFCAAHKNAKKPEKNEATARGQTEDYSECKTLKEKGHLQKYKSAGVCASFYNCGIINGIRVVRL
ncbi:uncharacterized protein LOC134261552, partial [Saccostrea cucullata]|uniref:uncharacterized protein LOC134261552 n=1 Tax=Saccostrea cuccullata TaxID=36930 RepID=UPI002ED32947